MRRITLAAATLLLTMAALLGCGESSDGPTPASVTEELGRGVQPAAQVEPENQADQLTSLTTPTAEARGAQVPVSPAPTPPVATGPPQRSPVSPQVFPMPMQVSYVTAKSLGALVSDSTLIVIGTTSDAEPREERVPGRLPGDPSKPDPNYTMIGNVYDIQVERYLKGEGGATLRVIQSIGFDAFVPGPPNTPGRLTQGRNDSIGVRLGKSSRYLLFLTEFKDVTGLWTGTVEPYRFLLVKGRAQVESPVGDLEGKFPSHSEDELVSLVESLIAGKSGAVTHESVAAGIQEDRTWELVSVEEIPLVDNTFAMVRLNGDAISGFDGCNAFGGRNEDGTPVAAEDGTFSILGLGQTEMLCEEPEGTMEQAEAFTRALVQGERFRVEGDRLEVIDGAGEVILVLAKQESLPGQPVDPVGTAWQLVAEDDPDSGVRAPTLAFLNEHIAAGVAACRGYVASYSVSEDRIRFPSLGMTGSKESCARELFRYEAEYTTHFTWTDEYSVDEGSEESLLRIRTRQGRTLVFEPLSPVVDSMLAGRWSLTTFVEPREGEPGAMRYARSTDVIPKTEVTIEFSENGVSGSAGCNSYSATLSVEDSTITVGTATVTRAWCDDPERLMEQERHYLDIVSRVSHFLIFGDRLALQTDDDEALLFRLK